MASSSSFYRSARAAFAAGRLDESARLCRSILDARPDHVEAMHLLALVHQRGGAHDQAQSLLRRVVAARPQAPALHVDFGISLAALGRGRDAERCYLEALRLDAGQAAAHVNLANLCLQEGRLDDAVLHYRGALAAEPEHAVALSNMSNVLRRAGNLDQAVDAGRRAVAARPDAATARVNLAAALAATGCADEAAEHCRRAVRLDGRQSLAWSNLGTIHQGRGRLRSAIRCYRIALRREPKHADTWQNLGHALKDAGLWRQAVDALERADSVDPGRAAVHNALGNLYKQEGDLDRAVKHYEHAVKSEPDAAETLSNLGTAMLNQGRFNEALSCFEKAMSLRPDWPVPHSNKLFALNYMPDVSVRRLAEEHERWARAHADPVDCQTEHDNERQMGRPLRVGYLSADLRRHPVGNFMQPALEHHDRSAVEVFCYADMGWSDTVTRRLRACAARWRSVHEMTNEQVFHAVRADRIDILVDLAGHTGRRLVVLARRPAPVQVTYLGYPNTTGTARVDFRLTDAVADPPESPTPGAERLLRLDSGLACFTPPPGGSDPGRPAGTARGALTFGSLNNGTKLNDGVISLWCRVLHAVADSRLLLFRNDLRGSLRLRLQELLRAGGIHDDRVELMHRLPPVEGGYGSEAHLAGYRLIDIALDPFPWNGHATTCEALWMGVPVITLRGDRCAGRLAASVLTHAGLERWIADSQDDYVRLATELAENPEERAVLRSTLRGRLMGSPLCDAAAFTRCLENAYRKMWAWWCEQEG